MKIQKSISEKTENKIKLSKVFEPLTKQQLESVIGGPETSRGTETTVQHGG